MCRLLLIFALSCIFSISSAQELSRTAFSFLNVPASARMAALGGVNASLADRDPAGFFFNPALSGDTLNGYGSINYQFYVADIGNASFSYQTRLPKVGSISFGVQHFTYGSMPAYDDSGNEIGEWRAGETALIIGKQHQVRQFRFGGSLKFISSSLAGFRATGIAADIGGIFIYPGQDLTFGLTLKNIGAVLSDYTGTSQSYLPFDVQFGATFKPEHMPIRFSVTVFRLAGYDAVSFVDNRMADPRPLDRVLRHFNFGAELLIHRNVNILLGYNGNIRQELKLEDAGGAAGLSFGFSARVKTIDFAFCRSVLATASPSYSFSLAADMRRLLGIN